MKNLYTTVLCLYCTFFALQSATQPIREPDLNRPKLFQLLPDTIPVELDRLTQLLGTPIGHPVSIDVSNSVAFTVQGSVASGESKFGANVVSIVIRSTNYPNAHLSFTRVKLEDGSILHHGRIMSFTHGDMYELRKNGDHWFFLKRGFYDVVNE